MNKVNQPTRFFAVNKKHALRSELVFVPGDYSLSYSQDSAVDDWAYNTFRGSPETIYKQLLTDFSGYNINKSNHTKVWVPVYKIALDVDALMYYSLGQRRTILGTIVSVKRMSAIADATGEVAKLHLEEHFNHFPK